MGGDDAPWENVEVGKIAGVGGSVDEEEFVSRV